MFIVHVFVHVKKEYIEQFKAACRDNGSHSIAESGIARFDVVQQQDDPTRFVLVEVYRTPDDPARHKQTPHYKRWRDTVEPMMVETRTNIKYNNIFPADAEW